MKILYVTTVSNTVNAFLIPHIRVLVNQGHQVDVAFNIDREVKPEIKELGCKISVLPFERSPFNKNNIIAYKKLKKVIQKEKYDLIHTHTPVASAIVRFACRKFKDIIVIYTAHGFHFFKGAPLKNWLIYYPVERILARYTDVLITINKEDYNQAKEFKAKKVEYIPGVGLEINKFKTIKTDKSKKRNELGIPKDAFIVLSVGELNKNKNHETVIRAIGKLNNPGVHYIICGQGPLKSYLKNLAKKLGIERQVHLLGFREDVAEIYKISDVFVFPSYREGLSVALMEAMANGLPVVCSRIRGNIDIIENGKGGFLVAPNNYYEFSRRIEQFLKNKELMIKMGQQNFKTVKTFSLSKVLIKLNKVYSSLELRKC